jgi:mannose/cellobiose epimerase-like protein (N-acyl-D-glucosamine 2-epimerase family)
MNAFPRLHAALPPYLAWLKNDALPFWATTGVDHERGGFHERLDLGGRPIRDVPKRLMVQGRQLYVYCHAGLLGWFPDARRLADQSLDYLLHAFYRRDGEPGFVCALAPDGSIADAARDTYAHAFVLLGLAWYHRLTGQAQALAIARGILSFLDEAAGTRNGGYLDAVPPAGGVRRQNPHMHLFEALLALHAATGDAGYLARATALFGLFRKHFFRPDPGWLCEYFDADWEPLAHGRGQTSEPGHHYEWVWLLRNFQAATGVDVDRYCDALYAQADLRGWDGRGFIVDAIAPDGRVLKSSRRTWPHTEALKANIAEGERGRADCDIKAARCLAAIKTFIGNPVAGGWMDHVDAEGQPLVAMMPASTLYHLFCAFAEAARVAD